MVTLVAVAANTAPPAIGIIVNTMQMDRSMLNNRFFICFISFAI